VNALWLQWLCHHISHIALCGHMVEGDLPRLGALFVKEVREVDVLGALGLHGVVEYGECCVEVMLWFVQTCLLMIETI